MVIRYVVILAITSFVTERISAQTAADYTVQLETQIQKTVPQIKLTWKKLAGATSYQVYKKSKNSSDWGAAIATVAATDSFYADNNVIADSAYEYAVIKQGSITATGYIYAGIRAPAIHTRGALMLLVDTMFANNCSAELYVLMKDLSGDGWEVIRNDLPRSATDFSIRNMIINARNSNINLNAVLIIGHVAVPYSGDINPDGHPDHKGAWPADVYYGDVNDTWTDVSVNNTTAARVQNRNIPGDGKWDQSKLPGDVELEVSRIDFANMPDFSKTEVQMMKSYLTRAHQYKTAASNVPHRGLIDDNIGAFSGEAFAQNGWRNFAVMVGRENINQLDFLTTLNTNSYQWAYGCGSGSYTSAAGIGTTGDFASNNVNAIFTMMFGSYFADWDAQNSFLRAPLCANVPALTAYWAGRPNLFLHHMALGENIGYSVRLSQNNSGLYTPLNAGTRLVHQALMGDLSLRTDYIAPPANVVLSGLSNSGAQLSWKASSDPGVTGYYVYRSGTEFGQYVQRSQMVSGTSYTDSSGTDGTYFYMVRAVKLQSTPSGSYYNLSLGSTDSGYVHYPVTTNPANDQVLQVSIYPNPAKDILHLAIASSLSTKIDLSIIDMLGRTFPAESHQIISGLNNITVDVALLPAGVYYIVARNGDTTYTKRWLKMN